MMSMGNLMTGWIGDGGVAHAVDTDHPGVTVCGELNPATHAEAAWADAPAPRCVRCLSRLLARA